MGGAVMTKQAAVSFGNMLKKIAGQRLLIGSTSYSNLSGPR